MNLANETMRKLYSSFGVILALSIFACAQGQAWKFEEFDFAKESRSSFIAKSNNLIYELAKHSISTTGFIAIDAGDVHNTLELRKAALDLIAKKHLESRVVVSNPYGGYNKPIESTTFWIVPAGAEPPYILRILDIFCATISVDGPVTVPKLSKKLRFVANISGGEATGYRWSVSGGRIVSGQGTQAILVKINRGMSIGEGMSVTATVKFSGFDPAANCIDTASFSSILAPLPNID